MGTINTYTSWDSIEERGTVAGIYQTRMAVILNNLHMSGTKKSENTTVTFISVTYSRLDMSE